MRAIRFFAMLVMLFLETTLVGAPIQKSGPCPPLTRRAADTADDWSQFPVRPAPADSFPVGTLQNPLTPAQSINCIELSAGLKAELWASEEMAGKMAYVQHFAFDERGRLWAVEPRSYPNNTRAASGNINDDKFQGGNDRIIIMEDTNGDKVMDKFKVFRDGLNLPQSIEVVNGGVVVAMAPYLVFFPNVNDTAGTPVILFSGMGSMTGSYDTQGGINSLMYGLDNWIYGHTGYNSTCNVNGVNCGSGAVWRFRHTSLGHAKTEFEVWSQGQANSWGIGQMEDGQVFQSSANSSTSAFGHINHAVLQGIHAVDIRTPDSNGSASLKGTFYPITGDRFLREGSTGKNTQGWFTSISTGVSGMQFYTSRLFPKKYWNRFAFTCEGASKLCNQDSLVESGNDSVIGSSWKAIRLPGPDRSNLLASHDAWVAPILAKTGPDGAVWVLDWNSYNTLHAPNAPVGNGGAWVNELRNKNTNRIYRILPEGATPEPILDLTQASEDQLIATFSNTNFIWRLAAQRLLIGKGYTASLGDKLKTILKTNACLDAVGNCPPVQHALWTLDGMGQFAQDTATWNPILADLLKHPAWCVRRNVLRILPHTAATAAAINSACSVNDPHGHVRLQALLALADISGKPSGLKPLWKNYRDVDALADTAFVHSGLSASDTLPCTPALAQATIFPEGTTAVKGRVANAGSMPRIGLRFLISAGGFQLESNGNLSSGILLVYDTQGRLAFTSKYESTRGWSVSESRGLNPGLYPYEFRGVDGSRIRGRLAMLSSI